MSLDVDGSDTTPLIPDLLDCLSLVDAGAEDRPAATPLEARPGFSLQDQRGVALQELPALSGASDWARWLQHIEGLARVWNIWDYVDPADDKQLVEPARPAEPVTPTFDLWTVPQPHKTDQEHEARLAEHKLRLDLTGRVFAMRQEQHRLDCIEYGIKLGEYAAAKEEMNQLNRMIYASLDDQMRSHVTGAMTATPRLKLKTLQSLVLGGEPRPLQDPPRSDFAKLMAKMESRDLRDWVNWAFDVANLSRGCEELDKSRLHDQMAKDAFLDSVQLHHNAFYERWNRIINQVAHNGDRPPTFQDLVDDFVKFLVKPMASPEADAASEADVASETDKSSVEKKTTRSAEVANHIRMSDSPTPSVQSSQGYYLGSGNKRCPGCLGYHRITGDEWWRSCWVFDEYMGKNTAPKWFKVRDDKVDNVKDRMMACPRDKQLATAWDKQRTQSSVRRLGLRRPE